MTQTESTELKEKIQDILRTYGFLDAYPEIEELFLLYTETDQLPRSNKKFNPDEFIRLARKIEKGMANHPSSLEWEGY